MSGYFSRPNLAVATALAITVGTIYFVHWDQNEERARMRQGVQRDIDRQIKKQQNLIELQKQRDMTKRLELERDQDDAKRT
eukprot:Clim_evm29s235 gene=Clim_evmTU29s235